MAYFRREMLAIGIFLIVHGSGCTRTEHRADADREAYQVIAERNLDPRWSVDDYSIEVDPRSRFFDKYDPDHPPMPPDDPGSHRYMKLVNGIEA